MTPNANAVSLEPLNPPALNETFPRNGIGTTLSAILIFESEGAAAGAFVVAVAGGVSDPAPPDAGSAAMAFMEATVTTDAHATAQQVLILMIVLLEIVNLDTRDA
jgi:hypothetical protein